MDRYAINYRDETFLRDHIKSILDFYHPTSVDESGGFFQNFRDDGTVFNPGQRHLVSSTRMIFNYCKAYRLFGDEAYRRRAAHGLAYLRERHWDGERGAYHWTLNEHRADDQTNHCYGLAFVVLAFAAALDAGFEDAAEDLERAFVLMEKHFWLDGDSLYADEATSDWSQLSPYRGQNANMHSCEAMLAAFEATADHVYLERAYQLAKKFALEMADKADGLIWEHYTADLSVDWEYNRDDPKNLYRPWGFQPGHQTEWCKLLLILYGHCPEPWLLTRAQALFDRALAIAWDQSHGGILYGFAPDGSICDDDKYFWVQAETFAAAARLATVTGEDGYWDWYDRIWDYAYRHLLDHRYGAWYRVLNRRNEKLSDAKSTAGGKCDYHTLGACWDVLRTLGKC
ncbi:AGE family epimerase/isomerase [Exilibacterium tricleocarpae]|uniref:AGE family epimerase/isomerase n=1 Tax=Exilibacterium tricleocarpae TaxID=2591008 RepID=A0A545U6L6_9GAMM|nr:AGE family epimerase/isomerase [Exilibacterium tricleocarpae]TQV85107.1 AGE family epimerase/isomerase [Exilibacterium tricleocarpae]